MAALPLQIYNYAASPYDDWHTKAWGSALVLIVVIGAAQPGATAPRRGGRRAPMIDDDSPIDDGHRWSRSAPVDERAPGASPCASKHLDAYYGAHHAIDDVDLRHRRRARSRRSSARPAAASPRSSAA